jgi:PAS domain S-box-containing protein
MVGAQAPATLITDQAGLIVSANAAAARLLNLTTRGARERSLLMFFEEQRHQVAIYMERAAAGRVEQFSSRIRPRDRRPFDVQVHLSAAEFERGGELEWALEPLPAIAKS